MAFLSKFAIDFFLFFALSTSIYYLVRFKPWHRIHMPIARDFSIPIILGLLCGSLSLASWMGPILFLEQFRTLFVLLPLTLFVRSHEDFINLLALATISALASTIYGYFDNQAFGTFHGLHRIGRYADMVTLLALGLIPWLFQGPIRSDKRWISAKTLLASVIIILILALALTSIRGSWLAFAASIFFFALFFKRWLLVGLIAALFIASTLEVTEKYREEAFSIGHTQENESNMTRLSLWQVGIDLTKEQPFFGTGSNNSEEYFIAFFNNMPKTYQEKHHLAIEHPSDWHNSYLHILVQNGLFVFIGFLYMLIAILFRLVRKLQHVEHRDKPALIAAILAMLAFGISQFFHSELFSYGAVIFYLVLYGGLRLFLQADRQTTA